MNTDLIYLTIAVGSAVFAVFLFFRRPQEKGEINDAIGDERYTSLKDLVLNLRDNHLHTIETKLDNHISAQAVNELMVATKLGGIEAKLDMLINK
jgi:hypothetical protein